jgi:hypothetical protein
LRTFAGHALLLVVRRRRSIAIAEPAEVSAIEVLERVDRDRRKLDEEAALALARLDAEEAATREAAERARKAADEAEATLAKIEALRARHAASPASSPTKVPPRAAKKTAKTKVIYRVKIKGGKVVPLAKRGARLRRPKRAQLPPTNRPATLSKVASLAKLSNGEILRHLLTERNGQLFSEIYDGIAAVKPGVSRQTVRGELWRLMKLTAAYAEGPHLKKHYFLGPQPGGGESGPHSEPEPESHAQETA